MENNDLRRILLSFWIGKLKKLNADLMNNFDDDKFLIYIIKLDPFITTKKKGKESNDCIKQIENIINTCTGEELNYYHEIIKQINILNDKIGKEIRLLIRFMRDSLCHIFVDNFYPERKEQQLINSIIESIRDKICLSANPHGVQNEINLCVFKLICPYVTIFCDVVKDLEKRKFENSYTNDAIESLHRLDF